MDENVGSRAWANSQGILLGIGLDGWYGPKQRWPGSTRRAVMHPGPIHDCTRKSGRN